MRAVISLLFILLFNIVVFSQDISLSSNSSEKYNKRGFFKNEDLILNGNEVISDYDGNLMLNYSTRVNLPADQSGDFTITYNSNVDHRLFDDLENPTQGNMVNAPEWILGFRGFALQTLNFETNFFTTHADITNATYQGEDIALLIPGYHYSNSLVPLADGQFYDCINILRADGSKIVLQNVKDHARIGLYQEVGFEAKGFAVVEYYPNPDDCVSKYRKIWYKPGDGFTYVFEERTVNYCGFDKVPLALYLTQIMSPSSYKYDYYVQLNYTNSIPNATIDYGRKVFKSLEILNYDPKNYKGTTNPELSVSYGYTGRSLLNIKINNFNTNKNLTLSLSAPSGSNISLFGTDRDQNSLRKLNVTSIKDDLGRIDKFYYHNWTDDVCYRLFATLHKDFVIRFPLLDSVSYYTGKSSTFEFYNKVFSGSSQNIMFHFGSVGFYYPNRQEAYRDCFTNFMLKTHALWNKYGTTNTLSKKEMYTYTFDQLYNGKLSVNGIKTKIEEFEGSLRTRTTVKNYSEFRTNKPDLNASDREYTIKLMSENVAEWDGPEVIEKYYTYDIGNLDESVDPFYTGTMDLWKVKEIKKDDYTSKSSETIDSTAYTYENSHISYNGSTLVRPIKKTETKIDPNQLIHFTEYLNLFPIDTMFYTNNNSLYSIGLPREEKTIRSGVVISNIVKEYYERGDLGNKLKKVANITNPNRQSYNIYTYFTGPSYMSLLSAIDNDKGARQEFYYPNTSNFQETIPGFIVKYDGTRTQSNFYHCGYQMQPFKILTIFNNPSGIRDTLINYSSYNPDGTLQSSVDENGLYSTFAYDKVGRLIAAALPTSFIDVTPPFFPNGNSGSDFSNCYTSDNPTSRSFPMVLYKNFRSGGSATSGTYSISSSKTMSSTSDISSGTVSTNSTWNPDPSYDDFNYFYCSLSNGVDRTKTILKATLKINILCDGNYPANPMAISILGISSSGVSVGSIEECSLPNDLGNEYREIEVDVTNIVKNTSFNRFKISVIPNGDPQNQTFLIQSQPVSQIIYNIPNVEPGVTIDKQPDLIGSVVYSYDDVKNVVTQKRRLNSDPNPLNFKEVVTKELLDGLGQVRADSIETDLKVNNRFIYELKDTNTYNSDGKVLIHTDGEGRTITNGYDFLQRLIFQTNGNGIAKHINYIIQPDMIKNGSYSASYSEYTRSTDEIGKEVYTYYDKIGNKVAEKVGTNPPTIFQYDSLYRLSKVISPNKTIRSYYYDELGNLRQKDSPADEGTTYYRFDKYKRLRFTMNSAAPAGERGITFTKYDQFGRVLVIGTLTNDRWVDLDADKDFSENIPLREGEFLAHFENYAYNAQTGTQPDTANFVCVNMYDKYLKSGIFARMPDPFTWSQNDANSSRNLKGKLVLTAFRDKPGQGWNYRIYLYDYLGHVNHIYQKFGSAPWKLIAKGTNILNNITTENVYRVEGPSLTMEHATWKNYDKQGRLTELRSDPAGNYNSSRQEATYTYNKADQCSTLTYNTVSNANKSTTYTYSQTRGWLNSIVNGSGNFSESLGYYGNGNIQKQILTNSVLGGTQTLTYSYDAMNRLDSVLSGTSTREAFQYDADGNFNQRDYLSGGALNSLYFANTGNKLSSVFTDTDEFQYYYDNRGNVTGDQYSGISNITYDHRNLPLSMTRSSATSKYRYDDGGNRIFKDAQGKKEYYFRDDLGHEFAVYDVQTNRLSMINLYGSDLIGRIDANWTSQYDPEADEYTEVRSDSRKYYVKDHLGSIRQTLSESGVVQSAMDYYAFGGTMSSYVNGSTVDKYKFTGKERDMETGLDYFGARYYDSKICRWMSVDPLAEKYPGWSPYNYCGNNPLMLIDPDGMQLTTFIESDGTERDINDGSSAVFKASGKGTQLHYEFEGFDATQKDGAGVINVTTVVQEAQNLNANNPALQPGEKTYCNFATQNIMKSLNSAGMNGTLITGVANQMQPKLDNSNAYKNVNYETAKGNAANGGLSLYSSIGNQHGHVGTFSVGANLSKGEVANIGRKNGFMQLFRNNSSKGVYSPSANVKYFILNNK